MVERYGFLPACKVIAFTGDNPATLAGMRLQEGELMISLGTSDTISLWLTEPRGGTEGHVVFVNPIDTAAYMALLCFRNASLVRERMRDTLASNSWEIFSDILSKSPPGNHGNIGMYFDSVEVTPFGALGHFRFNADDIEVPYFDAETELRALIEGQIMAKRVHAENIGYNKCPNSRILATGGASVNKAILQVISDVFNTPVYTQDSSSSAGLGCAYRAKHGMVNNGTGPFFETVKDAPPFMCSATPNSGAEQIYGDLISRYKLLEKRILDKRS